MFLHHEAGCSVLVMAGCRQVSDRMSQQARQDVYLFGRQGVAARLLTKTKTVHPDPPYSPIVSIGL